MNYAPATNRKCFATFSDDCAEEVTSSSEVIAEKHRYSLAIMLPLCIILYAMHPTCLSVCTSVRLSVRPPVPSVCYVPVIDVTMDSRGEFNIGCVKIFQSHMYN